MNAIDTILFDMYGVIIEESKGNFIPYTYANFDKSQYERLTKLFREEKLFTRAGNGEFGSDFFLSKLGFKDTDYHMRNYIENHLTLDKGFVDFAEKYSATYDFILLSNDVSEWSKYITAFHKLDQYFIDKIVSGDVKCRKPQKQIFKIALERTGKKAEQCMFIDNTVSNLKAASKIGITSILFNRDGVEYDGKVVNSFAELEKYILSGQNTRPPINFS